MSETDPRNEPVPAEDADAPEASGEAVLRQEGNDTVEAAGAESVEVAPVEPEAGEVVSGEDSPAQESPLEVPAGVEAVAAKSSADESLTPEPQAYEPAPEAIADHVEEAAGEVAAEEIVGMTEAPEIEAPGAEEAASAPEAVTTEEAAAAIEPAVEAEIEAEAAGLAPTEEEVVEAAVEEVTEAVAAEEAAPPEEAAAPEEEPAAAEEPTAEAQPEAEPTAEMEPEEEPAPEEAAAAASSNGEPATIGVPGMDWYIIHSYSGFENKVRESLRTRADAFGFGERIGEILIPTEDVVEMRNGKKVTSKRLLYPGYVLVQLKLDDELWHVVKNTPRVTGFVGGGQSPAPLSADEVNQILYRQTSSEERPRPKLSFDKNDRVKIIDGPFTNFTGAVEEVNTDRNTLKVMVTIFGRATPVELEYFQVEKEQV